jgi:DNA repair exonuclease SbcCD ATPase subunit
MANLPTESAAGRQKRLDALEADNQERARLVKERTDAVAATKKQKARELKKRIRSQRSQDKKRREREAAEQHRAEVQRLADLEAKLLQIEAENALRATKAAEAARRGRIVSKAVKAIDDAKMSTTLATWHTEAKSAPPTCGCTGTSTKKRRNRKKAKPTKEPVVTDDAIAKADAAMAALLQEEEAAKQPKLTKKQKRAIALDDARREAERLAADRAALARERAEAEAARKQEIEDDLDRQHRETVKKLQRQAELDKLRRQEERAATWTVHSKSKREHHPMVKRWRPCRSVELGRPCNRGDSCRSAHSLEELTIEHCRFHNCGRCARRPDGTFYNVDNDRPCGYIHEGERQDNYLRRLGMHVFLREDHHRRPGSRAH